MLHLERGGLEVLHLERGGVRGAASRERGG